MKIYILGQSGSGKSHLAAALSNGYKLPHIEIDRVWLKHGGRELYATSRNSLIEEKAVLRANIKTEVEREISKPNWVIDGNYKVIRDKALAEADQVILLDPPVSRTLTNLLTRQLSGKNKTRGYGLEDFAVHFQKSIWSNRRDKIKLQEIAKPYSKKLLVLHSRREVNDYLRKLEF